MGFMLQHGETHERWALRSCRVNQTFLYHRRDEGQAVLAAYADVYETSEMKPICHDRAPRIGQIPAFLAFAHRDEKVKARRVP